MRPPQNAGEDDRTPAVARPRVGASMRPPQNAGEDNVRYGAFVSTQAFCFNEAPAERGGRRKSQRGLPDGLCSFNEAPAERGGRRRAASHPLAAVRGLQ